MLVTRFAKVVLSFTRIWIFVLSSIYLCLEKKKKYFSQWINTFHGERYFSQWRILFTVKNTFHSEEYFSQWRILFTVNTRSTCSRTENVLFLFVYFFLLYFFWFLFYQHPFIYLFYFLFSSVWIELCTVFFCIVTDSFFWLKYDYSQLHGLVMFRFSVTTAVSWTGVLVVC